MNIDNLNNWYYGCKVLITTSNIIVNELIYSQSYYKRNSNGTPENGKWNFLSNWKRFKERRSNYSNTLTKTLHSKNIAKLKNNDIVSDNIAQAKSIERHAIKGKLKQFTHVESFETMDVSRCQFIRGCNLRSPVKSKRKHEPRLHKVKPKH